jgi:hypothetical protein
MFESVRREVRDQIRSLGLATQDDIKSLRAEIAALKKGAPAAKKAPAKKAPAKKAPAKKAAG